MQATLYSGHNDDDCDDDDDGNDVIDNNDNDCDDDDDDNDVIDNNDIDYDDDGNGVIGNDAWGPWQIYHYEGNNDDYDYEKATEYDYRGDDDNILLMPNKGRRCNNIFIQDYVAVEDKQYKWDGFLINVLLYLPFIRNQSCC